MTRFGSIALVMCAACACGVVSGQDLAAPRHGGKLLLTAGTSQIEGAAGAALTPWAVIGGYGTREQWGASAFHSELPLGAFRFQSSGALVGLRDRVELSIARQRLRPDAAGPALGQDVFGVKWRISGDAVFDQDRPWPQLALGVQHKRAERGALLRDSARATPTARTSISLRPSCISTAACWRAARCATPAPISSACLASAARAAAPDCNGKAAWLGWCTGAGPWAPNTAPSPISCPACPKTTPGTCSRCGRLTSISA